MTRKKRLYQEQGALDAAGMVPGMGNDAMGEENLMYLDEAGQQPSLGDKIREWFGNKFGSRQKWHDIGTSMGDGKAMVSRYPIGNERIIKEKGPEGKLKTKYNPDGTIKKQVLSKGLRRIVNKPTRDDKLSEFNRMRNIQDEQRAMRNPEVQQWIMDNMPELFND